MTKCENDNHNWEKWISTEIKEDEVITTPFQKCVDCGEKR